MEHWGGKIERVIETKRLRLFPFELEDLENRLTNHSFISNKYHLCDNQEALSPLMKKVYRLKIDKIKNGEELLLCTYFGIVLRSENRLVGEIAFKGPPDEAGCVEIGYGLEAFARGNGYMTEVLKGVVGWVTDFRFQMVRGIRAFVAFDNASSQKTLLSAGFFENKITKGNAPYDKEYVLFIS
jgi:RimJ/RimL family protein N-acetyltransferase